MYTTRQLVVYGNWLETRVLVRFDRGMAKGSNRIMAECASIMAMYGVERNIVEVGCWCSLGLFACLQATRLPGLGTSL